MNSSVVAEVLDSDEDKLSLVFPSDVDEDDDNFPSPLSDMDLEEDDLPTSSSSHLSSKYELKRNYSSGRCLTICSRLIGKCGSTCSKIINNDTPPTKKRDLSDQSGSLLRADQIVQSVRTRGNPPEGGTAERDPLARLRKLDPLRRRGPRTMQFLGRKSRRRDLKFKVLANRRAVEAPSTSSDVSAPY